VSNSEKNTEVVMDRQHIETLKRVALNRTKGVEKIAAIEELAEIALRFVALLELQKTIGAIMRVLREEKDE